MGARATRFLAEADELLLCDVIFAECVFVLESVYEAAPALIAELMRALIELPSIVVINADLLLRALELYEVTRLDFGDAYLVAGAELSGVDAVASFDRGIAKHATVEVLAP